MSIFAFKIIDETEAYLVVDKPPFLLVHPTKPTGTPTLWKELCELLAFEIVNGGQVSIVNRLDRETSGLVLIAKTSTAARRIFMRRATIEAVDLIAIDLISVAAFCERRILSNGRS